MNLRVHLFRILVVLMILSFPLESRSQLGVNTGTAISMTPLQFVQTYLAGTGVTVLNATYNGSSEPLNSALRIPLKYRDQIGSFTATGGAQTQLGIEGGVILSTGYVFKAKSPANPSDDMEGTNQPFEGDGDLYIIANKIINDKSILEFDFIPQTDVITFRYVFASLEFDDFCTSNFNDAFGLFLSGPGIAGGLGFANDAVNIALLPGGTNYVTIFNICAADVGNTGNGVYSWWNALKEYFSYHRFSYVLSATYSVTCNLTYHMKFAIGDAFDGSYDSGVFIEQNSFSSNNMVGSTSFSNPLTGEYLVEGCGTASLVYEIPKSQATDYVINLTIDPAGTATQDDILPNPFPTQVVIPAGQLQTPPILIQAVADGLTEPIENLIISATANTCTVGNAVTTELWLKDLPALSVSVESKTICAGTPVTLTALVTGGQPILPSNTFNYLWNTTATTQAITLTPPPGHTNYTVDVTDACNQTASTSAYIDAGSVPVPTGPITGLNQVCTPVTGITYTIPPMTGADFYTWTVPAGATIISGSTTNSITVDFSVAGASGSITVKGTNNVCGEGPTEIIAIVVAPSPQPAGSITGQNNICTPAGGVSYSIPAIVGATTYVWTIPAGASITSGSNSNTILVDYGISAASGTITVFGQSVTCGAGLPSTLAVSIHPSLLPAGAIAGITTICTPATGINYSISPIANADSYIWTWPSGASITGGNGTNVITVDFIPTAVSGTISVKGHSNYCGDGIPSSLALSVHPTPQAAGSVTGPSPVCQGTAILSYSIAPLAYTTSYDWSIPAGISIVSGAGTNQINCLFTTSAISGVFSVRGYNAECSYGLPAIKPVIVNPLPGAAGLITSPTGAVVCQGTSGVPYMINPIANAATYFWNFTGTGSTLTNNGTTLLIDFSLAATSGNLKVTGQNGCGDGQESQVFPVTVNLKPTADFLTCNDLKTTKNGRPIILKGGRPFGTGGVYSGTGVFQVSPGIFVFDPADNSVVGGGTVNGIDYNITYRYTNVYNCFDEKSKTVSVFISNANDPCPGTVKDYRDNQSYPTFFAGSGINARCWTASNLNYGSFTDQNQPQTDNCLHEKYCRNNLAAQCNLYGGYYQWGELMQYQAGSVYQDICPPGWHVATASEWDNLINSCLGNSMAGSTLKDTLNTNNFHGLLKGMLYQNSTWAFGSGSTIGSMFWTADPNSTEYATSRGLNIFNPSVSFYRSLRSNAFPVRCVRN